MPDAAKAVEAVCMLDAVLELFGPAGERWMRGRYHDPKQGRFCLVGAMNYLQRERRIAPGASDEYLHAAIWPRGIPPGAPPYPLVWFNDNGRRTFNELRTVIEKARTLAQRDAERPEIERQTLAA
jgi:hypothetical protein